MALEQLSLGAGPVDGGADGRQPSGDGGAAVGEGSKAARLPRWTRQEILVLIRGKRAAESRVRRGRAAAGSSASGPVQAEPKWEAVSSYCRRFGVNRGPVQCRKRWSNLAADYKKIKEWESRATATATDDTESFWAMRNDLRRERKLPGFFDREVFNILDGGEEEAGGGLSLALRPAAEEEAEPVFDSGRSAAADDGLFSDSEHPDPNPIREDPGKGIPDPDVISVSEEQEETIRQEASGKGKDSEKQAEPEADDHGSQEGRKRKRDATDQGGAGTANLEHQLIDVLVKNGEVLSSMLESQNVQHRLEREQRNDHANGLLTVLNKLADALGRIADKL
ncbi:trihelix transcription factor ASR3 [Andrographis paniculata]|uniref:trihelix transcription factor ASR3 n=1 Tax=Andrographis paniculata TaxID=175694 RepID=UPI0021E8533E|nr:trihelix transcription factor ASR3 [Andrographis paniculata]